MTRSRTIYKIRHRWGIYLGLVVQRFPRLAITLRSRGIPMNGYVPFLPRRSITLLLNATRPTRDQQAFQEALQEKIESQPDPEISSSMGKVQPIRIVPLRKRTLPDLPRNTLVSSIWPGDPYGFEDETTYLHVYQTSHYALSPKKGGWDTMRSAEIVEAGAFPLIPKLRESHPLNLHFYPKDVLHFLWAEARSGKLAVPSASQHKWIKDWKSRFLTPEYQMTRVLTHIGFERSSDLSVVYLDLGMMHKPDYLSMANYVGLARTLAGNFWCPYRPKYLFATDRSDPKKLYGRGFGYHRSLDDNLQARVLPELHLSNLSLSREALRELNPNVLIVGGIEYLDAHPKERAAMLEVVSEAAPSVAIIYGGDFPITKQMAKQFEQFGSVFAREFSEWP